MYKPYNFEEVSRNKTTYSAYFDQQQEIAREDREKALTDNIVDLAAADLAYSATQAALYQNPDPYDAKSNVVRSQSLGERLLLSHLTREVHEDNSGDLIKTSIFGSVA
ncbi:hypothetical protein Y032_0236g3217 [Ancylostoma ceylanicum]|nr:hypothetical protein Y032_0236g3217 [Ancylostoma ceylanicum]